MVKWSNLTIIAGSVSVRLVIDVEINSSGLIAL